MCYILGKILLNSWLTIYCSSFTSPLILAPHGAQIPSWAVQFIDRHVEQTYPRVMDWLSQAQTAPICVLSVPGLVLTMFLRFPGAVRWSIIDSTSSPWVFVNLWKYGLLQSWRRVRVGLMLESHWPVTTWILARHSPESPPAAAQPTLDNGTDWEAKSVWPVVQSTIVSWVTLPLPLVSTVWNISWVVYK